LISRFVVVEKKVPAVITARGNDPDIVERLGTRGGTDVV
jgi:hypothetical protein